MSAQQIDGAVAKPSFFARVGTFAINSFKPATPLYSLAFGALAGLALSGAVYAGRTMSVLFFDPDYYKLQSRKRYFEKQLLFTREQEEVANAHYLASLSAEYNPAATRMPGASLDPKFRF
mmetsp:Transcript_43666/g.100765  ORF Transcript_43666/g.100765 Transcript_43666/m.100765 type:complete len:120 (+) Transcript_43666:82-441(+)